MKIENLKLKIGNVAIHNVRNTTIGLLISLSVANVAHAASFSQVVNKVVGLINGAAGVLIGLAFFFTAYAVFKYLIAGSESTKRGEAATMIMWGIIGIFVIVSMWGIVFVVVDSFFTRGDISAPSSSDDIIDPRLRN